MAVNKGKGFESQFRSDWVKAFPGGSIIRLQDQMTGYKEFSKNICDFICYNYPNMFLIECKSHKGASLPLDNITQYDKLKSYADVKGLRVGIVLWLYEKDKVFYIPISTIKKLKEEGEKSVGIRHLNKYNIIEIPSEKMRVYMRSDYRILSLLQEGE